MATVNDWNFQTKHVGTSPDTGPYGGQDFVTSESIVVCSIPKPADSEPANYSNVLTWIPIGLLENATLQQNKQVQQLFEIGSKKSFSIPGRTYKRLNLSRIMFNGGSLLKVLNDESPSFEGLTAGDYPAGTEDSNLFIDIASEYFNRTLDLGFVLHDQEDDRYGAFALTGCFVQSHQMSFSAQQTVIMENVSLIVDDIIPADYEPDTGTNGNPA